MRSVSISFLVFSAALFLILTVGSYFESPRLFLILLLVSLVVPFATFRLLEAKASERGGNEEFETVTFRKAGRSAIVAVAWIES